MTHLSTFLCCALLLTPLARATRPAPQAEPFDLADVRLLPGPFQDAQERHKAYLLRIDPDRLMHWYRVNNGLPSAATPYGPFAADKYDQLGHYQGHHLSGCALMWRSTGDPRFKERVDRIVSILGEVQDAAKTGLAAPFSDHAVRVWHGLEKDPALPKLRLPWYALHKVYAGLIDAHTLAGNAQALDILNRSLAWVKSITDSLSDEQMQAMLDEEHGGIHEAFANAYALTRDPDHLKLAQRFCHRKLLDPLARGEDILDGLHANTQVPKFVGYARLHELTGEANYRAAATNFWTLVVRDRSYVTGGNSNFEHFTPKSHLSRELSTDTSETCNTYNMLKLTRHLFAWTPRADLADYSERALYNHILSSQNPADNTVLAYHNLQNGNRKFGTPNSNHVSMACCAASGQENHGKYGDSLYFHHGKERLFVNLFIASTLNWKDAGLTVRQDTTFPVGGESTLTLTATAPVTATISIRKPWWAGPAFSVQVNDQPATTAIGPEGYVDLNRTWKSGDRITIILPRTFHLEGFADNTNRAAVMYGPLVMVARTTEGSRLAALRTDPARALASLKPAGDPLTFTADERNFARDFPEPKPVTFQPLFREHEEPFLLFWDRVDDTQWKSWTTTYAAELKRWTTLAPTTVDIAFPGVGTPRAAGNLPGRFATLAGLPPTPGADRNETTARNLRAYTSWQRGMNLFDIQVAGLTHTCRAAGRGNPPWFSYDMTVVPGKPQTLLVRVWTPPAGDPDECRGTERGMEIRVAPVPEGKPPTPDEVFRASTVIGTLPAASSPLGAFEEFRLPLPQSLAAAPRITVICAPQPKRKMGIVSELRIIQD